jgi:hypothetical protein
MATRRRSARPTFPSTRVVVAIATLVALVVASGMGAVATNAFGAGDRFESLVDRIRLAVDPPPDRPTVATVEIVEPSPSPSPRPSPSPATSPAASPVTSSAASPVTSAASAAPSPSPEPARRNVDVNLHPNATKKFNSQVTKDWCAVAGSQITLALLGLVPATDEFQRKLAGRIDDWESWRDSHNGGWGPAAIVQALDAYGAEGYEIHAHKNRQAALRDAARALTETGSPAIIIAWRGAHTWVMTGYRADADPTVFADAVIEGAYVFDPWYPRVSSIWGPSDPPGTFQDAAEMRRNFLPWKRPEGKYPDRDGRFIVVVPTISAGS